MAEFLVEILHYPKKSDNLHQLENCDKQVMAK